MEVEIVALSTAEHSAGQKLQFTLSNVDISFANGLRRVMLSEVPTLAIDEVTIRVNTSVYPDEMLAHRLGLVPIKSTAARHMEMAKDCDCSGTGCDKCQVMVNIEVRCPADQHSRMVTSQDLSSNNPDVIPVAASSDGVWLFTLGRSQEFAASCKIRKGIAKLHSKWMAVATVAMQYVPEIRLNSEGFRHLGDEELVKKWVDRCPRKVFEFDGISKQVIAVDPSSCIYCRECLNTDKPFDEIPEPLVSVRHKKDSQGHFTFNFVVESTGVLPAMQIVTESVNVMRRKLQYLRASLNEGSTAATAAIPTRPIGIAPTAPLVANEDQVDREDAEDNIEFVMA